MIKSQLSALVALFVVGAFLTGAAPAGAAVLFQDDFESDTSVSTAPYPDTSGDYDPCNPAVGEWHIDESDIQYVQVSSFNGNGQPPAAHSGENYLIGGYAYHHDSAWHLSGLPAAKITPSTDVVIDFWFYGDDDPNMMSFITSYDSDLDVGCTLIRIDGPANKILYVSGGYQPTGLTWLRGQWNHMIIEISIGSGMAYLTVNDQPREEIGFYDTAANVGYVRFYSDYDGFYDDITITDAESTTLTVNVSPSFIDTTTPAAGIHDFNVGAEVPVNAGRYVNCPDVYVFDHWIGDVADTGDPDTTILLDGPKTVTAVYVDGRACNDECHTPPPADLNDDCYVNIIDVSLMAHEWLICKAPECD